MTNYELKAKPLVAGHEETLQAFRDIVAGKPGLVVAQILDVWQARYAEEKDLCQELSKIASSAVTSRGVD